MRCRLPGPGTVTRLSHDGWALAAVPVWRCGRHVVVVPAVKVVTSPCGHSIRAVVPVGTVVCTSMPEACSSQRMAARLYG